MELVPIDAVRLYDENKNRSTVFPKREEETVGKESRMNFAENLRTLREKHGITQEQLAERMEVSRQTVSKWESGGSFPEMEKMMQLADLFSCTLDALLKGDLKKADSNEAGLYEEHGNRMAKRVTAGVCLCILGLALQAAMEFFLLDVSGIFFFSFALVAVILFVRAGIASSYFRKKHPYVEPFYTEEQKERFHEKYTSALTAGIGTLIASVIWLIFAEEVTGVENGLPLSLFFLGAAIGVGLIVYIALQASKYNIEAYNADNAWENSEEGKENDRKIGKGCGIIMTVATAAYVGLSAATGGWGDLWWLFAVGGILCGAFAILMNRRKD